jgi:hypothetical protein
MNFGMTSGKFWIEFPSCSRDVFDVKTESEIRARELWESGRKLMLGLSTGLDSQVVLHSFYSQGFNIDCAFLFNKFNTTELDQLKILEKKYGFTATVIEVEPIENQERFMKLSFEIGIPPNQILQREFLSKLPDDVDFIQGLEGPNFSKLNNRIFLFESYNSFEKCRLRGFSSLGRKGSVISWERTPELMLSILKDDHIQSFLTSFEYIVNNQLFYENNEKIRFQDRWDLYIKPMMYGKYWGDELEYFPKYQGPEGIDYIINGPKHQYYKNAIMIPLDLLIKHLESKNGKDQTFWENVPADYVGTYTV